MADNTLAELQVTLEYDGNVRLREGGTQKLLAVGLTHLRKQVRPVRIPLAEGADRNKLEEGRMVRMAGFFGALFAYSSAELATHGSTAF